MGSVLLYDAHCWLCRVCRDWLQVRFDADQLQFADAGDRRLARQLGVTDLPQLQRRMCLVSSDGRQFWGYDALRELAREASSTQLERMMGWPLIARLGRGMYDWVAAHRSCSQPPSSTQRLR